VPRGLKRAVRPPGLIGAAAARRMSTPTPIVLVLVTIGLGLFGLRIFGIESLQYKWVLAISICLVAYGAFLYVIAERPNSN
jgi:protein-S-isoprenylcysteine O-methyltransferase Ste14